MMDRPFLCVILCEVYIDGSGVHGLDAADPLSVLQDLIRQQEPQAVEAGESVEAVESGDRGVALVSRDSYSGWRRR